MTRETGIVAFTPSLPVDVLMKSAPANIPKPLNAILCQLQNFQNASAKEISDFPCARFGRFGYKTTLLTHCRNSMVRHKKKVLHT